MSEGGTAMTEQSLRRGVRRRARAVVPPAYPAAAWWVPLDGTLAVMRTLDAIRERIGVRYPGERGWPLPYPADS